MGNLIAFLAVTAVAGASFFGFAWLARTDRRRIAMVLALLGFGWLAYLIFRIFGETYDITKVALVLIAIWQVIYTVAGALGWLYGRAKRRRT